MYVSRIKSNWKCAESTDGSDHELSNVVVLSGPNGSGKSTIIESIELALTGSVSGFLGRARVKDPRMLWRACPPGASTLFAEATLVTGLTIRWEQHRSNGKPTWTATDIRGDVVTITEPLIPVLPVAELRAALFGSPAVAERWLDSVAGVDLGVVYTGLTERTDLSPDVLDLLLSARRDTATATLEGLKSAQRSAAAAAKAATRMVEQLEHVAGAPVSDSDLAAAEVAVDDADHTLNVDRDKREAHGILLNHNQRAVGITHELMQVPQVSSTDMDMVNTAQSVLKTLDLILHFYPGNARCPCCKTPVGSEALRDRREGLVEFVDSHKEAMDFIHDRQRLDHELTALRDEGRVVLDLHFGGSSQQFAAYEPNLQLAVAAEEARIRLDELRQRRVATQAPGMAQTTAQDEQARDALLKLAIPVLESAISAEAEKALEALVTGAAARFPASLGEPVITFRPQVEIGLKRGRRVAAPSGGEEATLLLALAMAARPHGIYVLDDRGFDAGTLNAIIASVIEGEQEEGTLWEGRQLFVQDTTGLVTPPFSEEVIKIEFAFPECRVQEDDAETTRGLTEADAEADAENGVEDDGGNGNVGSPVDPSVTMALMDEVAAALEAIPGEL